MTSRERLLTTLKHQEPDRVPIDWGGGTTGIEVEAYDRLKTLLAFEGPTKTFVRDHVEIDEAILQRFGVDTRYVRVGAPRAYRFELAPDNSYVDLWGTRWRKPPSSLYYDMIGLLTPPVGIAVYIASNQSGVPVAEGFRKTAPFIIPLVVTLLLITYVPETVLFLPRLLFR